MSDFRVEHNPENWPTWRALTRRKWFLICCVLVGITLIWTPPLPIPISSFDKESYNLVQNTPKGSIVFYGIAFTSMDTYSTNRDSFRAFVISLAKQQFRIVFVCFGVMGPTATVDLVQRANIEGKYGYKYGVNYVIFPYLSGDEVAMASVAQDIHSAYSSDIYGTPTDSIPMMKDIHGLADAKLSVGWSQIMTMGEMYVRQWPVKYGVPYIDQVGTVINYYPKYVTALSQIYGTVSAAAALELLVGDPGEQLIMVQAGNIVQIFTLIMVIISVIKFQLDRMHARQKQSITQGVVKQ
jgi:hypothetical protein